MLFGGIITSPKFWVNIAAAKKATARNVALPTLTRSCFYRRWNRKNTARTDSVGIVNNGNSSGTFAAGARPLRQGFGEQLRHMLWPDIRKITNLMPATCP